MTGRRFHILSLLTIFLGVLIFLSDLSHISYIGSVTRFVNMAVSPIIRFKEKVLSELAEELGAYFHRVDVEKENIRLRRKINSLLLTEKELQACLSELDKLSKELKISPPFNKLNYSISRIIYFDPSGFDLFIVIEGGRDRGVKEGDMVVTEDKVVGVVESVFGSTSRVITPFNEKFSLSAVVGEKSKRYIYRGGFPLGELLHVSVEDKVKEGEDVFIAGLRRKFPKFVIGRVEKVSRGKDPFFKEVRVKPAVDPRSLEYVFVIRGKR